MRGNFDCIDALLQAGGHIAGFAQRVISTPTSAGQSPISIAAAAGHERTVELLAIYGADPHSKCKHGATAIFMAAQVCCQPTVEI